MSLAFHDLTLRWPDGDLVLEGFSTTIPAGRTGLIGANGSGKSTLLRLLAGDLAPDGGTVTTSGVVAWLRQDLVLDDGPVDVHLGIAPARRALRAIEHGDTDARHFDVVGDDWDVEERAVAELAPSFRGGRRCWSSTGSSSVPVRSSTWSCAARSGSP